MPGYLSLHQTIQSLTIKWTPNQLMNGYSEAENIDKSTYWAYALNVNVDDIVYVHCHQARGGDTGGTIILVGQDGVQRPPIHFPEGGHMAAFLSCLETGGIYTLLLNVIVYNIQCNYLLYYFRFTPAWPIRSSIMVSERYWQNFPMAPQISATSFAISFGDFR